MRQTYYFDDEAGEWMFRAGFHGKQQLSPKAR